MAELAEHEKAGLDIVFVPEAYCLRRGEPARLHRRTDRTRRDRLRHPADLHPDAVPHGHDGGRAGLRLGRPVHPRPGRVGTAGHRGLPRGALRRPDRAHPRDHRDLPAGLAPREGPVRRQALHDPAAARAGHRAGQAAQADQPPGARADPDPRRRPRAEERRARGGEGRGLAADLLRAGEGAGGLGRRPRGGQREARGRRWGRSRSTCVPLCIAEDEAVATQMLDGMRRVRRALRRRHGREGQELLQRRRPSLRLRSTRPRPSRTSTSTARRSRPRRPSRRSCCARSR